MQTKVSYKRGLSLKANLIYTLLNFPNLTHLSSMISYLNSKTVLNYQYR